MQRYTEQLIEDIREAKKRPRPPKMFLPQELEMSRGPEEYLHGKQYKLGKLFGLEKKQFPPIEKLSKKQIKLLVKEIIRLWEAFNFIPDFPEGLPEKFKYDILVDYLEHKTTYVSEGGLHIEFCTYEPASCPFPEEFCMCKDFEMPSDADFDEKDLPF